MRPAMTSKHGGHGGEAEQHGLLAAELQVEQHGQPGHQGGEVSNT